MVGLGGLEPPTSSLSGMRSSHLSYRPRRFSTPGGAGRDRTGDLLNANQALSQLSYSPLKPPALKAESSKSIEASWMQEPENPVPDCFGKTRVL